MKKGIQLGFFVCSVLVKNVVTVTRIRTFILDYMEF